MPTRPFSCPPWCAAIAICAIALTAYWATMPDTVTLEDSGSFLVSAYHFGIPHPPGYPTYTALAALVSSCVAPDHVATAVHGLSATCAALASVALYAVARMIGIAPGFAMVSGLLFALSPGLWSQAIVAEVYTLNAAFTFGLIALALRYRERGGRQRAVWFAFVFGLSLTNQWPLIALASPCLLLLVWPRRRELLRALPLMGIAVLLGLLPYGLMLARSHADPLVSFSGPIEDLWAFVSRRDYAAVENSPSAGIADKLQFQWFLGREFVAQHSWLGLALAVVGCVTLWRSAARPVTVALVCGWAGTSTVLFALLNLDYSFAAEAVYRTYPLPAFGIGALWIGAGLAAISTKLRRGVVVSSVLAAITLGWVGWTGLQRNDCRTLDYAEDYATTVLATVKSNAVVFTTGDTNLGPLAFAHHVLGVRPDITLMNAEGYVFRNRLFAPTTPREQKRAIIREFIATTERPVYFMAPYDHGFGMIDFGLYHEVLRDNERQQVAMHQKIRAFLDRALELDDRGDPGLIAHRATLIRRQASVLARIGAGSRDADTTRRVNQDLHRLATSFFGQLGAIEGALGQGEPTLIGKWIDAAAELAGTSPVVSKRERARLHELRGHLRLRENDRAGAQVAFQRAFDEWPNPRNPAATLLIETLRK